MTGRDLWVDCVPLDRCKGAKEFRRFSSQVSNKGCTERTLKN